MSFCKSPRHVSSFILALCLLLGLAACSDPVLVTHSVVYDRNDADTGTVPVDTGVYDSGASATVLGNTGSLARTGYAFAGWNTLANGSGTTYVAGENFIMGSSDATLYAKWNQAAVVSQ